MEKDKLLDLMYANNERLTAKLAGMRLVIKRQNDELRRAHEATARWEERAVAAEKKAESDRATMQENIDKLVAMLEKLTSGEEFKTMKARAEKAEQKVADLLASGKSMQGQVYGTKSQKSRKNDKDNDDDPRDAQSEKDNMGARILHLRLNTSKKYSR